MPQFLVVAYDKTDPEAPARRASARSAHLEGLRPMVESGALVAGGPIFDEEGRTIGTVALMDVAIRADLDAWLEQEPYVRQGVWHRVEIKPMRLVVRDGAIIP